MMRRCRISKQLIGNVAIRPPLVPKLSPRCYTQSSRPYPPRADGEHDGEASDGDKAVTDPIRLVRMVKEIEPLPRCADLADGFLHPRDKHVGVGVFSVTAFSHPISFTNGTSPLGSERDVV